MPVKKGGTLILNDHMRRFQSKTRRYRDCIIWIGGRDKDGYGKFSTREPGQRQQHHRAHRWLYEQRFGSLKGKPLRHRCDRPACVKLRHLVPGSQLQNVHDAMERGRRRQVLNPSKVRRIRTAYAREGTVNRIAERLGVRRLTAYAAAIGKNWGHV